MDKSNDFHGKIINQVGQYIYDNSERKINLDELANYTGFSKFHFNRLFFSATGYQLGEFIQRQKLNKALYLLQHGHDNILEVAVQIGYHSHSSFSRAFKNLFGLMPIDIVNGLTLSHSHRGQLLPKNRLEHVTIEPNYIEMPDKTIYGLYGKGFQEQSFSSIAKQLYERLSDCAEPLPYHELSPIGVAMDNPWNDQLESQFFAGFTKGLEHESINLQTFNWPAGTWAYFIHEGPHNVMWQTISKIYAQWVLPNNIQLKDQYIVQEYLNNPATTPSSELKTKLYFAIQ